VLVLPREHVETLDALSNSLGAALMDTTLKIAKAIRQVVQPDGYNLWQSNGEVAGQEVPHVHLHLLTRTMDDGLLQIYETAPEAPSIEAMTPLADRLKHALEERAANGTHMPLSALG
jgi:histidine triad (HIT) family protein